MQDPYYSNRLRRSTMMRKINRRIRPLSEEIQSASRLLIWTIGIMFVAMIVIFLYMNSLQSAKGYQLKQLQTDYEVLLKENREFQRKIDEAQSIQQLNEQKTVEQMTVPADEDLSFVGPESDLAAR